MNSTACSVIYCTVPNQAEAANIARMLVREGWVSCVNIFPGVDSVYIWEGTIVEESELVLIAKTTRDRVAGAIGRIDEVHSYETPCVTSWGIEDGQADYLDWLRSNPQMPSG